MRIRCRIQRERSPHRLNAKLIVFLSHRIDALVPHYRDPTELPLFFHIPNLDQLIKFPPHLPLLTCFSYPIRQLNHHKVIITAQKGIERLLRRRIRSDNPINQTPGLARNARPTKRAVGIALQPNVDAIQMKPVPAFREHSQNILFLKLTQTHNALVNELLSIPALDFPVLESGYFPDKEFVEAVARGGVGGEWVVGGWRWGPAGEGEAAEGVELLPGEAAFG